VRAGHRLGRLCDVGRGRGVSIDQRNGLFRLTLALMIVMLFALIILIATVYWPT